MRLRRSKLILSVLMILSAIFVVVGNNLTTVQAAPSVTLNKQFALRGALVTFTGSGFLTTNTACNVGLRDVTATNQTPTTQTCTMTSGSASGSFVVPNVATILNPYTVILNGLPNGGYALAAFTITNITITPSSGARGQTVQVDGSLGGGDTTCTISGSVTGTKSCVISGSIGGNFTGSFVVANVAPGPYTVRVTGSPSGVFVEATFIVTGPSIALFPSSGAIGTVVLVNGTDFSFADTTCTITSPSLGSVVVTPACAINSGTGFVNGTFTVGNVAPGSYVIRVTGSSSDFAQASFLVTAGPSITLTPSSGPIATFVTVAGTGFLPGDKTCTLTGSGSSVLNPSCSIVQGSGAPTGSFTVGGVAPGSYLITVTGNGGDSAQAVFTVTLATGTLTLNPTSGPTGTSVTFRATGFQPTDTGCVVQSADGAGAPGSNNLLITSPTCTMSAQVATGSFVVGSLATTDITWNVTVKGTPANEIPLGEWALFNVTAQITLSPTTGTNGTVVSVTGTGFSHNASTVCTLGITPSAGFTDRICGISGSSGHASASFKVAGAVVGTYVVNVTDSNGFFAGTTFQVGTPSANITLTPSVVVPGFSVGISGSGFNPSDTSCTVTPIAAVFTSSCSISGGIVAASLTILNPAPPGLYVITVTGSPYGDFASNYLSVAALTTQTSTTLFTSVSTTVTSTTSPTTTTAVSTSFSTTTLQTTGFSTWIFTSRTATTIFGQTTTSAVSTSTTSSIITFLTTTTTTVSTVITHTLGGIIQKEISLRYDGIDLIGLLGVLSLALSMLIRRYLT